MTNIIQNVDVNSLETSIRLLKTYLDDADTETLISALEALKADPQNSGLLNQVEQAFDQHPLQGAVLTYAPYIGLLFSDDPFE